MTPIQKEIFLEKSGREWDGKTYGSWSKHPDASLTAWHFTYEYKNGLLYMSLSNRMCGENYYVFDANGKRFLCDWDDMAIIDKVRFKHIIEQENNMELSEFDYNKDKEQYNCVFENGRELVISTNVLVEMFVKYEDNLMKEPG